MMRKTLGVIALAIGAMLLAGIANAAPKPSLADPALSPDGNEIAFVSGGDIWTAPAQGGVARLLISNPATESRPSYSPDGTRLAFQSTRDGSPNIYVLTFATGEITRLTYADANEVLDGWSADGKWIYFSSPANDVQRQNDIFRVAATGGTPLEVSRERYLNEFESAPSPDGKTVALIAKGISNQQWWRHGHSHIDETEVWLKPVDGNAYRRLLPANAKHAWPMWSHDGGSLYFMSDEDGNENLWKMPVAGGAASAVTSFKDGRLLWPSIGGGDAIVFERGFAIWKLDPKTGQTARGPDHPARRTGGGRRASAERDQLPLHGPLARRQEGGGDRAWRGIRRLRQGRGAGPKADPHAGRGARPRLVAGQPAAGLCVRARRRYSFGRIRLRHRAGAPPDHRSRHRLLAGLLARRQEAGLCARHDRVARDHLRWRQSRQGRGDIHRTAGHWPGLAAHLVAGQPLAGLRGR